MLKGVSAMRSGKVPARQFTVPAAGDASYGVSGQQTLADLVLAKPEEEDDEEHPAVIIDNREMQAKVPEHLSNLGAKISLEHLPAGDYAAGRVLIERKTIQDFVDTLVDRDLFGQVKALAESAIRPVMIVEGGSIADLYDLRNIHPNAIRNTLASIAADYDVSLLFTKDAQETAEMIYAFARREAGSERSERSRHSAKTARQTNDALLYILTAFPDVGPKAARELLREFGTLRRICSASKEELMGVKGIGEKTASAILAMAVKTWEE